MLSISVPNNVKHILTEVTPYFEANLREHFLNEAWRNEGTHPLQNIFVSDGNINIYLSNMHITKPVFHLSKFKVNLEMFNVCIEANLGELIVEGNVDESSISTATSVSKSGKIMFILEDVAFHSNVGIYIVEDSFVAKNYDINIKPAKISSKVTWNDGGKVENFENSEMEIEKSLEKYIWAPIINIFQTNILHTQFGVIVEQSVSELLIDEPGEMIAISAERASKCNDIVDCILTLMNKYFEVSKETVLKTPPLKINISKEDRQHGLLECAHGEFQNLSTFARVEDMNVYEEEGVQYIFGKIKLNSFKFNYVNCKARYGSDNYNDGTIKIGAYRSQIFIKLSLQQNGEAVNMSVDKVQVLNIRDVDFEMDNLQCLSSEQDRIQPLVLGSLHGLAFPVLEEKIKEGLTCAIQNKNV